MSKLYTPTHKLKKYGTDIWVVDGSVISFYGMPFTTRMVVIRLPQNELLIYSPIDLTPKLKEELDLIGTVKYLVSPNKIHYWYIAEFQEAYPHAITFASNGAQERAAKSGKNIRWDQELQDIPHNYFQDIEIIPLLGNGFMTEYTMFHTPSRTWIVTDIIENFEANKINPFFRVLAYFGGVLHPHGGTSRDQSLLYKGRHEELLQSINRVKKLNPTQIIMSHGKIIDKNVPTEIERIFSWV